MEGKAEKDNATHAGKRLARLGLRGHASAERLATCDKWQIRSEASRFSNSRTNGSLRNGRWIGAAGAFLHVGELVTERRHSAAGKLDSEFLQERVRHSGSGAMRQNKARLCILRHEQEARHLTGAADYETRAMFVHRSVELVRTINSPSIDRNLGFC
jgi:hypothetical protein